MKKVLISFLILFFTAVIAYGSDLPFSVRIKIDESSLAALSNPKESKGNFSVLTYITNISDKAQTLEISSYEDSWVSDKPAVIIVGRSVRYSMKNTPQVISLGLGKSYDCPLAIGFTEEVVPGPIIFKLGFRPFYSMPGQETKIIWSNPITITVDKNMFKNLIKAPSGGVTILKEDLSWQDIPFEVKRLMLKEGARNVEFSDEEKKLLSDEEKKLYSDVEKELPYHPTLGTSPRE